MTVSRTEYVQTQIVTSLNESSKQEFELTDIFFNKHTLRITNRGKSKLAKTYDNWEFELDDYPTSGQLIDLFRKMTTPYFIDRDRIILFSEEDAFMCKMAGLNGWIKGK